MPCSRCGQPGHNRRTCRAVIQPILSGPAPDIIPAPPDPPEPIVEIVSSSDEPEPEFDISAPSDWTREESTIVTLEPNSSESKNILKDFNKSFPNNPTIISVKRLQHYVKYMQYQLEKKRMGLRDNCVIEKVKEVTLYHGTATTSVESINRNGLNRSFGSIQAYGDGVYFARDAVMSANIKYAKPDSNGHQVIYVTNVLVGHSALGRGGMKIPPDRKPGIPYDSLVNCLNYPTIYVSGHNDNQMYAEYLVEFKSQLPTVSRFPQVGHLEIQNMDARRYELYWVPKTYQINFNDSSRFICIEIIKKLKMMKTIDRYSKSYQSIGSIGDEFIIVEYQLGHTTRCPLPHTFVGHIKYKDNPNKKMSVAIIQGKLVHL